MNWHSALKQRGLFCMNGKGDVKISNYRKALRQLEEYMAMPVENNRDRSGIIQAFEFTFEAFIKSCQWLAQSRGADCRFPRDALEAAIELELLDQEDEEGALQMLADRNITSHLYEESLAQSVFERVVSIYLPLFRKAAARL